MNILIQQICCGYLTMCTSLRTIAVTKADITERARCSEEKLQDRAQSHGLPDQQGLRPSQEN